MLSRDFTIIRLQNGLDRSHDLVIGKHGDSMCTVEYNEYDELLNSEKWDVL